MQRPIEYRDRKDQVWYVSEVARLKVVSAAIDGPNLCLVIRFEREGEERFEGGSAATSGASRRRSVDSSRAPIRRATKPALARHRPKLSPCG